MLKRYFKLIHFLIIEPNGYLAVIYKRLQT